MVASLVGCSSPAPKAFGIRGDGDTVLNRDSNGKSLSVVVRIYQLKDATEFSKLTFDTLAGGRPEGDLLGSALLEKTDVVLVPGGSYSNSEKLLDDTRFVGIVAFFRRPDRHHWRQLADANAVRSEGLSFRVQDCYVVLTGTKPVSLPDQTPGVRPVCAAGDAPIQRYSPPPPTSGAGQAPASRAESARKSSSMSPSVPDMNINMASPTGPVNAKVGNGGINSINFGEPALSPNPGYFGAPR